MTHTNASDNLAQIALHLRGLASAVYSVANDGHHGVRGNTLDVPQNPSLCDVFMSMYSYPPIHPGRHLDSALQRDGFVGYSHLASGMDGDVMTARHQNGHDYAIRITNWPARDIRPVSPMVVQPYKTHITTSGYVLEIMPMVHVLTHESTNTLGSQITTRITQSEGAAIAAVMGRAATIAGHHCTDFVTKDLAVLPDGTPIQTDPGQIVNMDRDMHNKPHMIRQGLSMLRQQWPQDEKMPAQFRWFTPEGTFKQDAFFQNPLARTPYYRGLRLSL